LTNPSTPAISEYLIPLPLMVVTSLAVALLALATGSDTVAEGLNLGLVGGIGISLMPAGVDANYDVHDARPWVMFLDHRHLPRTGGGRAGHLHSLWR
jgi:multisubunit Na+/H+ antiporter MnhB subunit